MPPNKYEKRRCRDNMKQTRLHANDLCRKRKLKKLLKQMIRNSRYQRHQRLRRGIILTQTQPSCKECEKLRYVKSLPILRSPGSHTNPLGSPVQQGEESVKRSEPNKIFKRKVNEKHGSLSSNTSLLVGTGR